MSKITDDQWKQAEAAVQAMGHGPDDIPKWAMEKARELMHMTWWHKDITRALVGARNAGYQEAIWGWDIGELKDKRVAALARAEALEEAAKVALDLRPAYPQTTAGEYADDACVKIAAAIRALKS